MLFKYIPIIYLTFRLKWKIQIDITCMVNNSKQHVISTNCHIKYYSRRMQ